MTRTEASRLFLDYIGVNLDSITGTSWIGEHLATIEAEAAAAERARIAGAVRGLPVPAWDDLDVYVDRAAVLAAIGADR